MTSDLIVLEPSDLESALGGQNTTQVQLGVQVPLKGGNLNVGASGSNAESDYARCVRTVSGLPGAKPADIREACGLPPSSAQPPASQP